MVHAGLMGEVGGGGEGVGGCLGDGESRKKSRVSERVGIKEPAIDKCVNNAKLFFFQGEERS